MILHTFFLGYIIKKSPLHRNQYKPTCRYFETLFISRRLTFCLSLLLFKSGSLQLMTLLLSSFFQVLYLMCCKPLVESWKNQLEMFNEMVVLGVAIFSTAFATEPNEEMGWFIIFIIVIQALVNFIINLVINARQLYFWVKSKCEKRRMKIEQFD